MLVVGTPGFQDRVRVPVASLLEQLCLRIPLPLLSSGASFGSRQNPELVCIYWRQCNCLVFYFQVFSMHLLLKP